MSTGPTGFADGAWWPRSHVLGSRRRVTLLVVPAETSPGIAHDALATAGRPDNPDTAASLLGSAAAAGRTAGHDRGEPHLEAVSGAVRN